MMTGTLGTALSWAFFGQAVGMFLNGLSLDDLTMRGNLSTVCTPEVITSLVVRLPVAGWAPCWMPTITSWGGRWP